MSLLHSKNKRWSYKNNVRNKNPWIFDTKHRHLQENNILVGIYMLLLLLRLILNLYISYYRFYFFCVLYYMKHNNNRIINGIQKLFSCLLNRALIFIKFYWNFFFKGCGFCTFFFIWFTSLYFFKYFIK